MNWLPSYWLPHCPSTGLAMARSQLHRSRSGNGQKEGGKTGLCETRARQLFPSSPFDTGRGSSAALRNCNENQLGFTDWQELALETPRLRRCIILMAAAALIQLL